METLFQGFGDGHKEMSMPRKKKSEKDLVVSKNKFVPSIPDTPKNVARALFGIKAKRNNATKKAKA